MDIKLINKRNARKIILSALIGILLFSALSSSLVVHAAYPTISVGANPYGVAFASSNGDIYVTHSGIGHNTVL